MMVKSIFKQFSLAATILILTGCSDDDNNTKQNKTAVNGIHIALEGEDNLRDLGGFVGTDGQKIASGKLFRSGELSALTDGDQQILTDLNLTNVVDLRSAGEIADKPDNLPNQITVFEIPLIAEEAQDDSGAVQVNIAEAYLKMLIAADYDASAIMLPAYTEIDQFRIIQWTAFFDLLESGESTLWHCTAGQDRAGMTAALVLASLGVSREDIMADYLMSNEYTYEDKAHTAAYMAAMIEGADEQKLLESMLIKEEYLIAFFDTIEADYGSVDNFLQVLGVDIELMQENFLVN